MNITYKLIAQINGEDIYQESYDTTSELQDGLYLAEEAVEETVNFDKIVEDLEGKLND